MSVLKCWTGGMVMLLGLAGGLHAEMTVSQSNDPAAVIGMDLTALLGQDREGLGSVEARRLAAIVTPPAAATKTRRTATGPKISYDEGWLAAQPAASGGAEFECLATALYFEARGESVAGQAAVAEVILNRVESPTFPRTICGVVNQSNGRGCQFSFTCDGRTDRIIDRAAWIRAGKIAKAMIEGAPRVLTEGATYFHTPAVRPSWARRFEKTAKIGRHIFYRAPIVTAMN
ncbi:MAG: cell wall hydrolase [Albidovulum sp.]